ncbi:MAG: glycosyltransferase family 2 protein [Lachnospiraceae bacterium]|nr:glycosyltransferase family 2 protein [Lachnospiraceae bacterium]
MVLQNIIFPKKDICKKDILYYRQEKGRTKVKIYEDLKGQEKLFKEVLVMENGSVCSFFTYFNEFSLNKWQEYTDICDFMLSISIEGRGKAYLCQCTLDNGKFKNKILEEKPFDNKGICELVFKIQKTICGGIVFLKLAAEKEVVFYSGAYKTAQNIVNRVKIAAGICTYHREEYIKKTMGLLSGAFLNDRESLLYGNLKLFISDNGNSLDCNKISSEFVSCIYNKNAGGTGGFTRCMLEALNEQKEQGFTHFLFMDDDILFEPEALYRTYTLLSMANDKYKNATIGGALLRTDFMEIQHACGESWNNGRVESLKKGYDLSKTYYLLLNEKVVQEDYNGWWYCCMPFSDKLGISLPLPVFIHRDDVEYNLRHSKKFMHLNGINVWHNTFENRRASNLEYYNTRNLFILNAIHKPEFNWRKAEKQLFIHIIGQICKYHNKNIELFVRAVEDFCKGPEFLKEQEPVKLHQSIMGMGYSLEDMTEKLDKYNKNWRKQGLKKNSLYKTEKFKLHHIIFANGWLLPGKRKLSVLPVGVHISHLFRVKNVLYYEPETGKGFECKRSYKELVNIFKKMYGIHCIMRKSYDKAAREYRGHYKELVSTGFWKKYLEMED